MDGLVNLVSTPPDTVTSSKMETVISMFPETVARIARLEGIVASLMRVNLQLAERVTALETALDEAPAVQIAGAGALGRATGGGAVSMARR
jgi:hypothetical protein